MKEWNKSMFISQESMYHSMFYKLPKINYFYLDEKLNYVFFNQVHQDFIAHLLNISIDVSTNFVEMFSNQEDRQAMADFFQRVKLEKDGEFSHSFSSLNKSLVEITLLLSHHQVDQHNGLVGIIKNQEPNPLQHETLLNSETLLQYLVEHDFGVAVHDRDLNYLYVSKKYLDAFGISHQNVIGKHHYKVFPDLPQKWRKVHQKALLGEVSVGDKDVYIREDGTSDWTSWECRPWYTHDGQIGGIIVYTQIINERMDLEHSLIENERRLSAMFNQAAVGMSYGPVGENFFMVNDKYCELVGYSKEELRKMSYRDITHPDDLSMNENYFSQLLKGSSDSYQFEKRLIKKDGSVLWIELTVSLIRQSSNQKDYVLAISSDINERKIAEAKLHHLSYHDQLTGLYNRRYYEEKFQSLNTIENLPLALILVDVNGLKLMNDAFGHLAGDDILIRVAHIMASKVNPPDLLARIGGDEFVIVLFNSTYKQAQELISDISDTVSKEKVFDITLSISYGIGIKQDVQQGKDELFKIAEDMLYRYKITDHSSSASKTIEIIMQSLFAKNERELHHSKRVSVLSERLAKALGFDQSEVRKIGIAGLMHDIGKIGIPDHILNKVGPLDDDEWQIIMKHSEIGYHILSSATEFSEISEYVLAHQEKYDGSGYPRGLKGEEIPVQARVIAFADAFDAMTTKRTYRNRLSKEEAVCELRKWAGTQFDPDMVEIFINKVLRYRK